ncbi:RNA polymerase I-specific transcription initiation factor RRN3-like protein isoform X1, partial [Tanacetum coccineum]
MAIVLAMYAFRRIVIITFGFGSPNKANSYSVNGPALGTKEVDHLCTCPFWEDEKHKEQYSVFGVHTNISSQEKASMARNVKQEAITELRMKFMVQRDLQRKTFGKLIAQHGSFERSKFTALTANAMSADMDDMISEVTYKIKKGLIFLGATIVDDKLQQWFSSTFDPITHEWIDIAYSWGQKVVSGIEAAWGAKKTGNETKKGWEHSLWIKRWSVGMRLPERFDDGSIIAHMRKLTGCPSNVCGDQVPNCDSETDEAALVIFMRSLRESKDLNVIEVSIHCVLMSQCTNGGYSLYCTLIEKCWYPDSSIRPKLPMNIIRLDKVVAYTLKQGWFKDCYLAPSVYDTMGKKWNSGFNVFKLAVEYIAERLLKWVKTSLTANAMSADMDDMISEVTYGIKKGLIFLDATTVEDKLQQRNQSTTSQALHNHKIYTIGFTHNPNHTNTKDNYNRDLILRRREERSLNNNSFLGEYECSSLALDREERRDEKKRLDHLKQDQTMLVIKRFSERKKVFRERKKTGKIHAK